MRRAYPDARNPHAASRTPLKPKAIPLVRADQCAPIAAFLERTGARVERILAAAGLPESVFVNTGVLIPLSAAARFVARAARTQGIDDLGLLAGQEARLEAVGLFGRMVASRPTLRDALETATTNLARCNSGARLWLAPHGDDIRLCHALVDGFDEGRQQLDHYAVMLMLGVLRLAAGPAWRPAEVQLQTKEARAVRVAEPLSDAAITFGQRATAVTFPRWLLDEPLRPRRPGAMPARNVDAWNTPAPADDFVGSVTQVVEMLSWKRYPHINQTADVLGMSVRSLQRYLAASGTSHESLVASARMATAANLLEETNTNILEIALDLGYSDHAHFSRAFRRWMGRSPQEFRRTRGAGAAASPC